MIRFRMALGRGCLCFLVLLYALGGLPSHAPAQEKITRGKLQSDIMRYILSYQGFMGQAFDELLQHETEARQRVLLQENKLANQIGITNIALRPYAEVNLLDVIVFVTLTRIVIEDHWVPKVFGMERGKLLIEEARRQETQAWVLARTYLKPEERKDLSALITRWRKKHQGIFYIEGVRFSDFADKFADSALARKGEGSFLFPSVSEATAEIEQARDMGERFLFYAQTLPFTTRETLRLLFYDLLNEPEVRSAIENSKTITAAIKQFNDIVEAMPVRVGEQLATERNALLSALDKREGTLKALLARTEQSIKEAQTLMTQTERSIKETQALVKEGQALASMVDGTTDKFLKLMARGDKDSDGVAEMQKTLQLASNTVRETDGMLATVERLLDSPHLSGDGPLILKVIKTAGDEVNEVSDHVFVIVAGLILFAAFVAVAGTLFYRYLASRFPPKPTPPTA